MQPVISVRQEDSAKRVVLSVEGEEASECWIIPITIRVGAACIRVDGIGGVETKPPHRLKGYASRVLHFALQEMTSGDAALTMLYGIPNFYHRFGYVTAGPEYLLFLEALQSKPTVAEGWHVREFAQGDLPVVQRIYEQQNQYATGAIVRDARCEPWRRLVETPGNYPVDECWVAVSPQGQVEGYAWRARWCWPVREVLEKEYPNCLVFGELIAESLQAAETLLNWCRYRAGEEGKHELLLALPPDSIVAIAARYHDARFEQLYQANGGSMVRLLHTRRLLRALLPELQRQMMNSCWRGEACQVQICTEVGEATLLLDPAGEVELFDEPQPGRGVLYRVDLPQAVLARLALGFAPPEHLCARLPTPLPEGVMHWLKILFPPRYQHAYLPDRY